MKPRKWVAIVFCCFLIAAYGLYEGVTYIENGRHVERLITKQLSLASGGNVDIGHVRLGFFSVYLQDVKASMSMNAYSLTVRDIKISFSLIKLLANRGDFSKSISKIILLSPTLNFAFFPYIKDTVPKPQQPIRTAELLSAFRSLPVDYLLVRKGIVTVTTASTQPPRLVGEDLSGKLGQDLNGISMEMRGKMASKRKNMFLSATFLNTGRNHHVSLRLDKAKIDRPFSIGKGTIVSGTLDGAVQFSFPDSVTAETFESSGWLHIVNGVCSIDSIKSPVTGIAMKVSIARTVCFLDSLRFVFSGIEATAGGNWDFAPLPKTQTGITLKCKGVKPELCDFIPDNIRKILSGTGWFEAAIQREKSAGAINLGLRAGGLGISGQTVTLLCANGLLQGPQISFDSLSAVGPGIAVKGKGIIDFGKEPFAYSVITRCKVDSIQSVPGIRGAVSASVSLRGLGDDYYADAIVNTAGLSYDNIVLGAPQISIHAEKGKPLSFATSSSNQGYVGLMGTIDSLGTKNPMLSCQVSASTAVLRPILGRFSPDLGKQLDSAWFKINMTGTQGAFSASGSLGLLVKASETIPRLAGTIGLQVDKKDKDKTVHWSLIGTNFGVSDGAVNVRAQGRSLSDTLAIDSVSLLPGLKATGLCRLGENPDESFTISCNNVQLPQINALAFHGKFPVKAGTVSGTIRIAANANRVRTDSDLKIRGVSVGFLQGLESDVQCATRDSVITVFPCIIRQNGAVLVKTDTICNKNGLTFSGSADNVDLYNLIKDALPEEYDPSEHSIKGKISAQFSSTGQTPSQKGVLGSMRIRSSGLSFDQWHVDSIAADISFDENGMVLNSFTASDSSRAKIKAGGSIPWSAIGDDPPLSDTLNFWANVTGDLIAVLHHNVSVPFHMPVDGHGQGTVDVAVCGVGGTMHVTKAVALVPRGVLIVKPYVPEDIKDFSFRMVLDNIQSHGSGDEDDGNVFEKASVSVTMSGTTGRRPVTIHSTHVIPRGFEPITIGFLDLGALLVSTPKRGIDIHVPGVTEIGAISDVEFAPRAPWPEFALSGPLDKLCISGDWILRTCDLTFPFLDNVETHVPFDPFPYITWNFDLRAGNRKVKYYFDYGKNRNLIRLAECYLDPVSVLSLRGRDMDKTFKIVGSLRSSNASVFYGRTFDRNVEIGLDFVPQPLPGQKGYDNMPIIWGSAEAISDTSRFERIKLTLLTRDSISGAWSEHGRFYDIHFRVGSNIENFPGQTEQRFVEQEKSKYTSVSGAGTFVTAVGEQYLHRILLQNMERRLAKSLGLDVITIETSIASNYFNKLYNTRQFESNRWDYLALANVGITLGRYILYDKVFLKWRTELVPVDTILKPQYNVGFEFQPLQFINMDFNYGVHMGNKTLESDPQMNLELRLPIKDLRKYFDF